MLLTLLRLIPFLTAPSWAGENNCRHSKQKYPPWSTNILTFIGNMIFRVVLGLQVASSSFPESSFDAFVYIQAHSVVECMLLLLSLELSNSASSLCACSPSWIPSLYKKPFTNKSGSHHRRGRLPVLIHYNGITTRKPNGSVERT